MGTRWWKIELMALMVVASLAGITVAQTVIGIDALPYTIASYGEVTYQLPDDAVAFNGTVESDPSGTDIKVRFQYYVDGPMTLWASQDGTTWTWYGDSHWMLSPQEPYAAISLSDAWVKYIRIKNRTYYNSTYGGAIMLQSVDPVFPGRDPTLPTNQPPVAGDIAVNTEAGSAVTINVLEAASDPDGDSLSVSAAAASHGVVAINPDNTVTYTPNAGFAGDADTFLYTVDDGNGGTATGTVTITVNAKSVDIDIKPGSYPNSINLGSNGVVPVAILSTENFDAATVDPATVSMGGAGVAVRGKANRYMASTQDVNGDGLLDLVLQVETENLDPDKLQDGVGTVVGATFAGVPIIGTDEIRLVPPQQ